MTPLTREQLEFGYNEAVALAADRFGQIKELVDQNAALRAENRTYTTRIEQLDAQRVVLEAENDRLTAKLTCVGQSFSSNQVYQGELERTTADLRAQLTAMEQERDRMEQMNASVVMERADFLLKLTASEARVKQLKDEKEIWKTYYEQKEEILRDQLTASKARVLQLEKDLAVAFDESVAGAAQQKEQHDILQARVRELEAQTTLAQSSKPAQS